VFRIVLKINSDYFPKQHYQFHICFGGNYVFFEVESEYFDIKLLAAKTVD
jgi:hypothetical protein